MSDAPLNSSNTTEVKGPSKLTADDINDLFNKPDESEELDNKEPKVKADKVDDADDKEEEDDDLALIEPDDEKEEKLDLSDKEEVEIDTPPRKREVLKKYPELFKDFPFLEKILYRDKQYNELFGSFDDAKEIADKAEVFNNFEQQLLAGNTEDVLRNVKEADSKAFDNIVDNYLQTLAKVDKDAYFEVVGNLNKRLIMEMVKEANETENDDLKTAAQLVNQFVFGTGKFTAPTKRVDSSKTDETSEAEKERLNFVKERFETSRDDLQLRIDNTLKSTISEYIDPKGTMSPYVKKNAVADALKIVNASLGRDTGVTRNLDKLWRAAFQAKFSQDSLNKIRSFYLSKAKPSLRSAIMKARAEALKDAPPQRGKEVKEEEIEEERTPSQRRNIPPGRPSQPKSKNEIKKGESVTDYFMRD